MLSGLIKLIFIISINSMCWIGSAVQFFCSVSTTGVTQCAYVQLELGWDWDSKSNFSSSKASLYMASVHPLV